MAKGKKTGGRAKGTPNKSTSIREAEIRASGLVPMDYFLGILRAPRPEDGDAAQMAAWESDRFGAAKELMPYCHARLASVEAQMNVTAHESLLDKIAEAEAEGEI